MIGLITVLSALLIIGAIGAFIGSFFIQEPFIENAGSVRERTNPGTSKALRKLLTKKLGIILLVIGLFTAGLSNSIYYAERGTFYEIIYPNGTKTAEFSEGYHLVVPFTRVNPWTANIDVKAGNVKKMSDDVEGKMSSIKVTFVDQVGADISSAYRFTLPKDEKTFLDLAVKYRSVDNLTQNTLIPTIAEQAKLTAKMFSAQDYISGSSQEFRQTFEEQLKGGTYVVKRQSTPDTTWSTISKTDEDRQIRDISIRFSIDRVKDKKTGLPKRIQNEISASGIIVSQVIVNDVEVDESYKKRLVAQKAESAQRQLEQQKIETAKIAQQRIKAEGERDKEQERTTQEKNQVKLLIEIETKLKQEKTNLELAKLQLETQKTLSEKVKIESAADAYKNRQMVSAGLTPQEKAEWAYKTQIGVAAEMAKMQTPQIVISGANGGGGGLTNSLIQAEMAKQLLNKKGKL